MLGIILGNWLYFEDIQLSSHLLLFILLAIPAVLFLINRTIKRYSLRWIFGLCATLFLFVLGACWLNVRLQQTVFEFSSEPAIYRVTITERPEEKERSVLCRAQVFEQRDSSAIKKLSPRSVLLYFALDSAGKTIRRGDELLVSTRLALPMNNGGAEGFDYRRYLIHKNISATGFVSAGKWQPVAHRASNSISNSALDCRDRLLERYRELGFEGDNFAVLSALTLGYKDELSEAIRESFSVSGSGHLLAISGLHVSFLYVLLLFLLNRLPGSSTAVNLIRLGVVISALWGFAFLTGLSPSVVRSVIMFSLLAMSRFFTGRPVAMNTLCVAGFGMLLYNPCWLFDVGFQLSFVAVASILLIQPWLYRKLVLRNYFLDKLWGVTTVSVAAQIGTAPLVLLYFSRFPVHFLLTNILVIPLVTVIIYVAIFMLVCSLVPVVGGVVAYGLNVLLNLLTGTVRQVEALPFASVDRLWVYHLEVLLFYLALFLFGWYVVRRRPRFLLACLSTVLCISCYHVYMRDVDRPQQSLVFYNVRNCPAVHCILPDGRSWMAYADSVPDSRRLSRVASGYWNRMRLSTPTSVTADYADEYFVRQNSLLSFGGKRVCLVNDNRWKGMRSETPFPVDYLYLCKGYTGRIEPLVSLFAVRQIILDSSLSDYRQEALLEECRCLGIPSVSLSEQTSYYKTLI